MIEEYDFMDRIFNAIFRKYKGTRVILPLYYRMKELMMYGLFGLGTFVVALSTYALFTETLEWNVVLGNSASWVFATLFAFLTNRKWVFPKHQKGFFAFLVQLWGFVAGRLVTLVIEDAMLAVLIGALHFPNMTVKILAQFIVVSLNYVFSKLIIFRKKPTAEDRKLDELDSLYERRSHRLLQEGRRTGEGDRVPERHFHRN